MKQSTLDHFSAHQGDVNHSSTHLEELSMPIQPESPVQEIAEVPEESFLHAFASGVGECAKDMELSSDMKYLKRRKTNNQFRGSYFSFYFFSCFFLIIFLIFSRI